MTTRQDGTVRAARRRRSGARPWERVPGRRVPVRRVPGRRVLGERVPGAAALRGFTLVELMVAVALVLLIIVGVNEVFRLTSDTVGAGQSLSGALRDQRATRTTLEEDFAHIAPDAPALIIRNQAVAAFRSRDEQLGSVNPNNPLLIDLNGDGLANGPGEVVSPATPGQRVRRVDSITFFVRRPLSRQTGNLDSGGVPTDLLGRTLAQEAMVTYGHLRLPNNRTTGGLPTPSYFDPAQPDYAADNRNDNNRYATQFVLGRQQLLMVPFVSLPGETAWRPQPRRTATDPLNLTPLSMATLRLRNQTATGTQDVVGVNIWESRVDLAAGDLTDNSTVELWGRTPLTLASFAQRLAEYERDVLASGGPGNGRYSNPLNLGLWFLPVSSDSYGDVPGPRRARESLVYRVNANPFGPRDFLGPANNQLATTLAQSAPVFLPRCTNFIVEFAGDFITQDSRQIVNGFPNDNYGVAYAAVPDGEIDYVVHKGARRIRWYGLPRYTNSGDVDATSAGFGDYIGPRVAGTTTATVSYTAANSPTGQAFTVRNTNLLPDVVPLSDVLAAIANSTVRTGNVAPFERVIMTDQTVQPPGQFFYDLEQSNNPVRVNRFLPPQPNYADTTVTGANAFTLQRANYVVAWRGGGPRLVRLTVVLEDAASQAASPQTFEYVFTLPY
ncbi:MAG: type II secretion system protein J [Tepidisphaerales bacterium]